MSVGWYALRTKPNRESLAWHQARLRGVECFYPRMRVRPVNPRASKVRPFFPGYLFVQADLDELGLSALEYLPYATGLVCFGGEPARVPDALINGLKRRVQEMAESHAAWEQGPYKNDRVWISDGPFAGLEAIFDTRLSGGDRVRLLLELLNGHRVPIEMDAAQIEYSQRI